MSLMLLFLMSQCCLVTCHLYQYHYITEMKNWSEAQQYCRKKYTDLATVSNMTDMTRLHHLVMNKTKEAWIGLYNETESNRIWYWSLPGLEYNDTETNWKDGEPDDGKKDGKRENCVAIRSSLYWVDTPCSSKYRFLCYDESNATKFQLIKEKKTWWEAQSYCREHHTDLVSGPQQLQDEELKKLVNNSEDDSKDYIFIGLFRDAWTWSDGSSFSFRHWNLEFAGTDQQQSAKDENSSQSDEDQNSKQCAVMVTDSQRYANWDCDDHKHFLCYDDKVILIREWMNWEDALYYCRKYHHDLVSITSLDEQRWVQEKAKKATTLHVWTGLRYTCTLDFWFWVSGEAVSYKNWASGQEGNDCDMSGAMETGGQHQWVKINDNEKMNFICSKT